ncbi:MAG: hypothetical protein ACE5FK_05335, partial [Candidatus Methylomirabilia bacterium]
MRSADRPSNRLAGLVAVSCLLVSVPWGFGGTLPCAAASVTVEVVPIELGPEGHGYEGLGGLSFLTGFELRSADPRFGGLSGLELSIGGD